jgi:hypothetical protein
MNKFWVVVVLLFPCFVKSINTNAQSLQFINNDNCKLMYKQISALQIDAANARIQAESKSNPTNVLPVLMANYIDFYELFFNENQNIFEIQQPFEQKRLDVLEKADKNSPYYLHAKGMIYFQWGLIKLKFKQYFGAAKDIRKAYQCFNQNCKKYPDSDISKAHLGSLQAAIGTIPNQYKWITNILGLKGDLKNGELLVSQAAESSNNPFSTDALFFLVYVKQYLHNDAKQAWNILKNYRNQCANNRLLTFMTANIAINQNKADEVIKVIKDNKSAKGFMHIPILDYELGCAYLYKLDNNCDLYFLKFLSTFKGNFYRKDAYYKLAMSKYIFGDNAKAMDYAKQILYQPATETDADKNAQQFAKTLQWPNIDLLKIRYLYDGGYFIKALEMTKKFVCNSSTQLEFSYRKSRIFDELNVTDSAIFYYKQTIALGKSATTYFAARACLQLGNLYATQGKNDLAKTYFLQSMIMPNTEYKNSIDMRAKAGLQKLDK